MKPLDATNAACRDVDSELWFPVSGNQDGPAKAICHRCGMRQECLDYAIETGQQFGIWGGENLEERQAEIRRRNKAARAQATDDLTKQRERLVLDMYRSGLPVPAIAEELAMTPKAVAQMLGGVLS